MTIRNGRPKVAVGYAIAHHPVRWAALAALCLPAMLGSWDRYSNFDVTVVEMGHYKLVPPALYAAAAIFLDMALS